MAALSEQQQRHQQLPEQLSVSQVVDRLEGDFRQLRVKRKQPIALTGKKI